MTKRPELYDETQERVEEWRQFTNNNGARVVNDVLAEAAEAVEVTGCEDPREAIQMLVEAYDGEGESGYDPDAENIALSKEQVEEMVERDPVPAINTEHVRPTAKIEKMNSWKSTGLVAGIIKHEFGGGYEEDDVQKYIEMYFGSQSTVGVDGVERRLEETLPEVEKVDVDLESWFGTAEDLANRDDYDTVPVAVYERVLKQADELVPAMDADGHERYDEACELVDEMRRRYKELVAAERESVAEELMDKIDTGTAVESCEALVAGDVCGREVVSGEDYCDRHLDEFAGEDPDGCVADVDGRECGRGVVDGEDWCEEHLSEVVDPSEDNPERFDVDEE